MPGPWGGSAPPMQQGTIAENKDVSATFLLDITISGVTGA